MEIYVTMKLEIRDDAEVEEVINEMDFSFTYKDAKGETITDVSYADHYSTEVDD
jgi:hypothetical protein